MRRGIEGGTDGTGKSPGILAKLVLTVDVCACEHMYIMHMWMCGRAIRYRRELHRGEGLGKYSLPQTSSSPLPPVLALPYPSL